MHTAVAEVALPAATLAPSWPPALPCWPTVASGRALR